MLYHETNLNFYNNILSQGLKKNVKCSSINEVNEAIDIHRPMQYSQFSRKACLFLDEKEHVPRLQQYQAIDESYPNDLVIFAIPIDKLNPNKLFIANYTIADEIYDVIHRSWEVNLKSNFMNRQCSLYWQSLQTYHEYIKLHPRQWYERSEALYFDDISPELLIRLR